MRTFYRYEHTDTRCGPYNHSVEYGSYKDEGKLETLLYGDRRIGLTHILDMEGDERPYRHFVSACESIPSLRKWFRGYNAVLRRLGFRIVKIRSNDYYFYDGQVVVYTGEDRLASEPST